MRVARSSIVSVVAVLAFTLTACSGPGAAPRSGSAGAGAASGRPSGGAPSSDKLAQILDRGTLVLSTDLEYPPQSAAVEGATRAASTRCAPHQLSGPEVGGFDVDTGKAVAAALGVEPCFVTPTWTEITGGNWGDRWDIAWGSGAINADRMTRLYMTQPYYSTPQRFFVRNDSEFQSPSDLSGMKIGACASCTHEYYLRGTLQIPGVQLVQKVAKPAVVTYQAEPAGLAEVANGSIDAFLCAEPVGQQAIADKLPLRPLDEAAFSIYSTGFVDRASGLDVVRFLDRIDEIVRGLHADGTLKAKSIQHFGVDYATAAAGFDLESIGQVVP